MNLNPCPKCKTPLSFDSNTIYPISLSNNIWHVGCSKEAKGCNTFILGPSKQLAIEKWNSLSTN